MPYLKANQYNLMSRSLISSEIFMLPSSKRYDKNIKYNAILSDPVIPCCTGKGCYTQPNENPTTE
jgi:hypothetical protein